MDDLIPLAEVVRTVESTCRVVKLPAGNWRVWKPHVGPIGYGPTRPLAIQSAAQHERRQLEAERRQWERA